MMKKKKQILEMITKKLVKKISRLLGPLVKNFDLKFNVKKNQFFLRLTKLHSFINSNF